MAGTLEVTVQQGLHIVLNELWNHDSCQYAVQVSTITFDGTQTAGALLSLQFATQSWLRWRAGGQCMLQPALQALTEALIYDLIYPSPMRQGDYTPLVFLILGGTPADASQHFALGLSGVPGTLHPLIITLVTRPELVRVARQFTAHTFVLNPAEGESMTRFFFWVAKSIVMTCESCEAGEKDIQFPDLPSGVVRAV